MSGTPQTSQTDVSALLHGVSASVGTGDSIAQCVFAPMRQSDLPAVEAMERQIYAHPWSLGNFGDSLDSGYQCWVVRDTAGNVAGYFLVMLAPDEAHLLNITVAPDWQGRGLARLMLERIRAIARGHAAPAVLLEVRPSNPHALAVYRHVGFRQIGLRKRYYPAADGQREDAIVMRLDL